MSHDNLKFKISTNTLFKELGTLNKIINNNPIIPILSNFLVEVQEKRLIITASDLHISIMTSLPIESNGTGKLAIPANMLVETLKNLADESLECEINLKNYTLTILSRNGKYRIACENAENFPEMPQRKSEEVISMPTEMLEKAIKQTAFAASTENIRPSLSGINILTTPEGITFAATDGYRLSRHICTLSIPITSAKKDFTLPARSLQLFSQFNFPADSQQIQFSVEEKNVFFWTDNLQVAIGLIEENYPNYEGIIPTKSSFQMTLASKSLQDALKVIRHYANKTTRQVRIEFHPTYLEIYAEDLQFSNEAQVKVPGVYEGEEGLKIGLNSAMVLEMLRHLPGEEISLHLISPQHPVTIKATSEEDKCKGLMLIMPLALRKETTK